MFKIDNIDFDIRSAILEAFIDDDENIMEWAVEIMATSTSGADIKWNAKLSSESIIKTKEKQLRTWKDIAGSSFSWQDAVDDDENEHGLMYIFQHEPVYDCKGEFYSNEKGETCIKWSGKCDVYWNEKYNKGLNFIVDTPLEFKGVWFGKDIEPVCQKQLSNFITNEHFNYKIERNSSLMIPANI